MRPLPRPHPTPLSTPEIRFGVPIYDPHTLEVLGDMGKIAVTDPGAVMATVAPGIDVHEHRSDKQINEAVKELGEHMESISGDPSGSEVDPYFSPEHTAEIKAFVNDMRHKGWPGAIPITMHVRRDGRPIWKHGYHDYNKSALYKGTFHKQKGESGIVGYVFGELGCEQYRQLVAICSDERLRSMRGPRLHKSYGQGFGVLPRADLLLPARDSGLTEGIVYDGRTIRGPSSLKNALYKKAGDGVKNPDHVS